MRLNTDDVPPMSYEEFLQGLNSANDSMLLSPDDWDFTTAITCHINSAWKAQIREALAYLSS
jgi:hypothetical protein